MVPVGLRLAPARRRPVYCMRPQPLQCPLPVVVGALGQACRDLFRPSVNPELVERAPDLEAEHEDDPHPPRLPRFGKAVPSSQRFGEAKVVMVLVRGNQARSVRLVTVHVVAPGRYCALEPSLAAEDRPVPTRQCERLA